MRQRGVLSVLGSLQRHALATVVVGGALLPLGAALQSTFPPTAPSAANLVPGGHYAAIVPSRGIKVISAGSSRTGSQSMCEALRILGFTPAHEEMTYNLTLRKPWMEWERGGPFEPALQALLDHGIDATTADGVFGAAYKELMERFPNAKVILTQHPGGPEGWLRSYERFVSRPFVAYVNGHKNSLTDWWSSAFEESVRLYHCRINETMTDEKRRDCMKHYQDNIDAVRRAVPPERLLEFNVTNGWSPLVKFLGLPTPPKPFPKVDLYGAQLGEFAVLADRFDDLLLKNPNMGWY